MRLLYCLRIILDYDEEDTKACDTICFVVPKLASLKAIYYSETAKYQLAVNSNKNTAKVHGSSTGYPWSPIYLTCARYCLQARLSLEKLRVVITIR